ncbi:MAG: peptidylprolyl isomerase, partial [Ferruginibacter sp.]|nr:peptidylprolyl isomerase [Ferruginibacter sp.]
MKRLLSITIFLMMATLAKSQSITQIKKTLDTTHDPIGYVKYGLKKKYRIDTVTVVSTTSFLGLADSLAYKGKIGKVYGPFKGANYLIKVLAKVPNTFYHVSHILIDTGTFSRKFADSLAGNIIEKIKTDSSNFETMARTYSADNSTAYKGGDLGWFIRGAMLPQLDEAIAAHKKGDLFKVWTPAGLHVVTIT